MRVDVMQLRRGRYGEAFFLARKPVLYALVILGVIAAASAFALRRDGIFACQAAGYSADRYLAYCHASNYGNYEHGAFWFGLEPSVLDDAARAQVLFLGDSRMQIALSTSETSSWFSTFAAPYYLLGFGYQENVVFAEALLAKIKPKAKVYVINAESFFERRETLPTKAVLHDPESRLRYRAKQLWQLPHKLVCRSLGRLCGKGYVVFRSRENGAFLVSGTELKGPPVSFDQSANPDLVEKYKASGLEFLSRLPVRPECVILTVVPTVNTNVGTVQAVARALGKDLFAPQIDGLETFDASHLDQASSERWSKAFYESAAPRIRQCLAA